VGVASVSFAVMRLLAPNAVFVFTGILPVLPAIPVEADTLMRQLTLSICPPLLASLRSARTRS